MTYPTIKINEDLRSFEHAGFEGSITDDELVWFVCISNAKIIFDTLNERCCAGAREGAADKHSKTSKTSLIHSTDTDDDRALLMNLILIREVVGFMGQTTKLISRLSIISLSSWRCDWNRNESFQLKHTRSLYRFRIMNFIA